VRADILAFIATSAGRFWIKKRALAISLAAGKILAFCLL
jgi:hypothetical protein